MTKFEAWRGDWIGRLGELARLRGYASLSEFAVGHPDVPFPELARALDESIPPMQIALALRGEADERGELWEFAKASLVRYLNEYLPGGWRQIEGEMQLAGVFADWATLIGDDYDEATEEIWSRLLGMNEIPDGWSPRDADDAHLARAFDYVKHAFDHSAGK